MTPTPQQTAICKENLPKGSLLMINAYAGTGKTSTLNLFARKHAHKRILYLCFNRDMAKEARNTFGPNVDCSTTHSLAFQTHGHPYQHKLGSLYIRDIVERYGVTPRIAALARQQFFAYLATPQKEWPKATTLPTQTAMQMWEDACNPKSPVPLPHDGYLKQWALEQTTLADYDFVFLDEAQDSNPIIMDFAVRQATSKSSAVLMVGDTHQAIYGWRGAVDAMQQCPHITHRKELTTCFRFPQNIADMASLFLAQFKSDTVQLRGIGSTPKTKSRYAVISRTNAALVGQAWEFIQRKHKPHFCATQQEHHFNPEIPYQFELIRDVYALRYHKGQANSKQVRKFSCFEELESYATGKHDGKKKNRVLADGELSGAVSLVKKYGADMPYMLNRIQQQACSPARASVTLSTAHRAKGQEWDHVKLTEDFFPFYDPAKRDRLTVEDANLIYVALTRAKTRLLLPDTYRDWFHKNK